MYFSGKECVKDLKIVKGSLEDLNILNSEILSLLSTGKVEMFNSCLPPCLATNIKMKVSFIFEF